MPWFKVDDKFHSHVKAARAGVDTLGLWVICGSWAADQLTDGFVPAYIALRFDPKARSKATRLVAAGLWDDATKDGEKGWQFHDWDDMQPVRTEVEAKRHAEREKKRRWREKAARDAEGRYTSGDADVSTGDSPRDTTGDSRVRPLGSPPVPDPTRPDPTRPKERGAAQKRGHRLPDDWQPTPELLAWAATQFPTIDAGMETDKFRDHWHAKTGRDATKLDWALTWKNWIRNSKASPSWRPRVAGGTEWEQ